MSKYPDFPAVPELTVRLREKVFLVPDVAVQRRSEIQRSYPEKPIYLVVEVLSPSDQMSDFVKKCESYHDWGVRYCWLLDPESRQTWEYESGRRLQSVIVIC
ncbi:MAG: Uma2 family endonuclease [Bryobacteraceae bacterium]